MPEVSIYSLLPDADDLLALEPEELAGVLLQCLNALPPNSSQLNRHGFGLPHTVREYPQPRQDEISRALMEAWGWLEREGLIAPKPGSTGEFVFVTRRGRKLATPEDLANYRRGNMLPRQMLHPRISQKVWATFLRGDYDAAVFQAFKEVEVAVREAGGFASTDIGVKLMRDAFDPDFGPLTDPGAPMEERKSLAHLFAGAIGTYKNPGSHRNVTIEPAETVEMIILASHLIRIVDKHRRFAPKSGEGDPA